LLCLNFSLNATNNSININNVNDGSIGYRTLIGSDKEAVQISRNSLLVREISINYSLISSNNNIATGDTLILDLFENKKYTAVIDKISIDINNIKTIRAKIINYEFGVCLIHISEGNFLSSINIPELQELYFIKKEIGKDSYYLWQSDISQLDILEGSPTLKTPLRLNKTNELKSKKFVSSPIEKSPGINDTANIDIMILYTPEAALWASTYDGGINNTISNVVTAAQNALDNSETTINLNLVHSEEINYEESGSSYTDLVRLTFSEQYDPYQMENGPIWYMEEAHTLRDQYAADMVMLLTKTSDTGGLSFLLENPNGEPEFPFSIVRVQQATNASTTGIHELGITLDVTITNNKPHNRDRDYFLILQDGVGKEQILIIMLT